MVLKDITISYIDGKYVVVYTRTHYYLGLIKGKTYVAFKETFDTLESAKYSIIMQLSDNKVILSKELDEGLSYADALRLSGGKGVHQRRKRKQC